MALTSYNPREVTCALGPHIVSGYSDDSMIDIEPVGDGAELVEGCDGEAVRNIDPTNSFTVKLTLLQKSPTNAFLTQMDDAQRTSGGGIFTIRVADVLGAEKFTAEQAFVKKKATWTRKKKSETREWELCAYNGKFN